MQQEFHSEVDSTPEPLGGVPAAFVCGGCGEARMECIPQTLDPLTAHIPGLGIYRNNLTK